MTVLALIMILVPGLISVRILWKDKEIKSSNYKYMVFDYLLYTFLILLSVYAVMFFSSPSRTVSLSIDVRATSHIRTAGFVFKFMFVSLIFALILPKVVTTLHKFFVKLESDREKRLKK